MVSIFISYAHKDQETALRLHADLERHDVSAWIDKKSLLPGQDWELEIRNEIQNCDFLVALLSKHSVTKRGFVQKELRIALEIHDELPPGKVFIIPVRLDDCETPHGKLRKLHRVDLFHSYQVGLEKILAVILQESRDHFLEAVDESRRRELPTGVVGLLHTYLESLPRPLLSSFHSRLNVLIQNSPIYFRMIQNLFMEDHLGSGDWEMFVNQVLSVEPTPGLLVSEITHFCRDRILIGPKVSYRNVRYYGSVRAVDSLTMLAVRSGHFSGLDEAYAFFRMAKERPIDDLPEYSKGIQLGRSLMWSVFDVKGGRPFDETGVSRSQLLLSLGLDERIHDKEYLLFEYQLDSNCVPHLPTFCDLYSSHFWSSSWGLPYPGSHYHWSSPITSAPTTRPLVIHHALRLSDLTQPIRSLG